MMITEMVNNKKVRKAWKGEGRILEFQDLAESNNSDQFSFRLKPGTVLTKSIFLGRETAFFNKNALQYNPRNHKWEKRLTRYLSWLWRISFERSRRGLKVRSLLVSIGMELNKNRLRITKDRFEKALNRLEQDGVIGSWRYKYLDLNSNINDWREKWMECMVVIHPPKEIIMHYEKIKGKQ